VVFGKIGREMTKIGHITEVTHGRIQWKGTDVCMDIECVCGAQTHIDADFFYYFECECGRKYEVSPYVNLTPLTTGQAEQVEDEGYTFKSLQ
jgi:hypothetical protein